MSLACDFAADKKQELSIENSEKMSTPGNYREFYEDKVERELKEKNLIRNQKARRARKAYIEFHKHLDHITSMNTYERTGPIWYQELSDNQINVLHTFSDLMRNDFDMCTLKHTKHALRDLGVLTFIPDTVAIDAMAASGLYPVLYLTEIKNYVMERNKIARGKKSKKSDTAEYSLYVKILMSSIVYLEFPNLIKKLDYCLPKPVPDKKLKHIELPKRRPIKYDSPYLEPLPEPIISWDEEKKIKWHNMMVQKQEMCEKAKVAEKRRLEKIEKEIENSTKSRMKITYPSHPLEKLFYRPPLIMGCSMEDEEEIIDAYESESAIFEMEEEASWSLGDSEVEHAATPTPEPDPKAIDATEWDKPDQWSFHNSSLIADTLAEPEIADMLAEPEISDGISHTPEELPTSSVRDESVYRLPHGWLKADHSEPYDPTGWFVRSSSDDDWQPGEYATDKSNMVTSFEQLLLNYDSSTSSASGRAEENAEHTPEFSGEEEDKVDDDKSDWKDDDDKGDWKDDDDKGDWKDDDDKGDEKHDDVVDPTDDLADTDDDIQGLGEQSWPVIDSKEKFRCQQFGVCGTPSSSSFITAPAVNLSTTTMWSTNKSWSLDVRDENVLERKQSNFIMFLVGSENNHSVKFLPSDLPSADETESKGAGNILYEQLDVIRKLPQWDRLNKTLELLSNMGDLIAGFPELTKLHPLKRWYEQRLNINRHMTLKYKKQLINESKAAWNISRPKFTNILIPRIKFTSKKTTGNDRDTIKQNIKYAKQKYTTKLKEMAISNARDMYLDTLNDYFDNPLSKKFKQTFFAYYPAKEDNCTFEDPPRMIEKNIKF